MDYPAFEQDWITEAEALDDVYAILEARYELLKKSTRVDHLQKVKEKLEEAYEKAKLAEVGTKISCPNCGKIVVKTTYHKTFCSNSKTHGKRNCKDRYHNRVRGIKETIQIVKKRLTSVNLSV